MLALARAPAVLAPTPSRERGLPRAKSEARLPAPRHSRKASLSVVPRRGLLRLSLSLSVPATCLLVMASAGASEPKEPKPGEIGVVDGHTIYTVKLGDTLSAIAKRYDTTVDILVEANKLESSLIVPGQKLWTPRPYTIQKGDTLNAIARHYGTTLEEILKINNINDPNTIQAGDILLLP